MFSRKKKEEKEYTITVRWTNKATYSLEPVELFINAYNCFRNNEEEVVQELYLVQDLYDNRLRRHPTVDGLFIKAQLLSIQIEEVKR